VQKSFQSQGPFRWNQWIYWLLKHLASKVPFSLLLKARQLGEIFLGGLQSWDGKINLGASDGSLLFHGIEGDSSARACVPI
jgi:hypothetical protein